MNQESVELSIVIVCHNSIDYLSSCLESIYLQNKDIRSQVIIVDNASNDGTTQIIRKKYRNIEIIENKQNVGYAKANNQGIQKCKGKFILLLNPDIVLSTSSLRRLFDEIKREPSIGMISPLLIMGNGKVDLACHRNFPNRSDFIIRLFWLDKLFPQSNFFNHYNLSNIQFDSPTEVECISGAFMLVRKSAIRKVGLLDERFFMYAEDLDWARRFYESGYKIIFYPEVKVIHHKRTSTKKNAIVMLNVFYNSNYMLYRKYYFANTSLVINGIIYYCFVLRKFLSLIAWYLFKRWI